MRAHTAPGAGLRVTGHVRHLCSVVHSRSPLAVDTKRRSPKMPYVRVKAMAEGSASSALDQTALVDYRQRLLYQARLTTSEALLSLVVSASACAVYYTLTSPAHISLRYGLSQALLFAATLTSCRTWLIERKYQGHMSAEQELKDKDSVFRELHGTTVHYKLALAINPEQPIAVHCYHGFGANTFSWSYVYKSLSEQLHAQVTKHDMPGFGLTLRPKDLSGYTLDYNGRLGRYVMDAELAAAGLLNPADVKSGLGPATNLSGLQSVSEDFQSGQTESDPSPHSAVLQAAAAKHSAVSKSSRQQPESPTSTLDFPSSAADATADSNDAATSHTRDGKRIKRVLVGHSVGAACAAAEYINHPEDIGGLVLVAPAITAFASDLKAQANGTDRKNEEEHYKHLEIVWQQLHSQDSQQQA